MELMIGFHADEFFFVHLHFLQLLEHPHAGKHAEDLFERTQFLDLSQLIAKILQAKGVVPKLPGHLLGLLFIEGFLGLFDEGQDIAHAQNARAHPIRVEDLQGVQLFADTDEFDGARVTARMERAAPPRASPSSLVRMTPVMPQGFMEGAGDLYRILTGHGIGDEQDFHRLQNFLEAGQFGHQLGIDVEPPGGVHQQGVAIVLLGERQGFPGNFFGTLLLIVEG